MDVEYESKREEEYYDVQVTPCPPSFCLSACPSFYIVESDSCVWIVDGFQMFVWLPSETSRQSSLPLSTLSEPCPLALITLLDV